MKSLILSQTVTLPTGAVQYFPPGYSATTSTATEGDVPTVCSTAGTIDSLYVKLSGAPGTGGSGKSYTFTLRKNGVDTALTCTITDTATTGNDTGHSVSFAAGDILTIGVTPANTPTARNASLVMRFSGNTANESVFLCGSRGGNLSTTTTQYTGIGGQQGLNATEARRRNVIPTGGTIKNLYVKLSTAPGAGTSRTFTLYKNGSATALTCTVSDAATTANDTTHSVSVAAGDEVSLESTLTGTPAASRLGAGLTFVATTDGESVIMGTYNGSNETAGAPDNAATNYAGVLGLAWSASEALASNGNPNIGIACTLKKMYVACTTAPGAGNTYTFDVRVNAASPANDLSVAISGAAATTGNDTSNTVTVADGDEIGIRSVPNSVPVQSDYRISVVAYFAPAAAASGNFLMFM